MIWWFVSGFILGVGAGIIEAAIVFGIVDRISERRKQKKNR